MRHRFIQALPPALGPAIASQRDAPLDQLGKLADELMPFTKVSALQVQAANDVQEVNRIQEARPANARPTSSTNWNARPTSSTNRDLIPFWEGQRNRICRSHIFYGNRAHTCKAWCHWPNKANCRISPNSRPSSPIRMVVNIPTSEYHSRKNAISDVSPAKCKVRYFIFNALKV